MEREDFITQQHVKLLDTAELKFILEHSEKFLKDVLDTGNTIVTRTTTLLTLMMALSIALIGFSITRWQSDKLDELLFSSAIGSIYALFIIIKVGENFRPIAYKSLGSAPKPFFVEAVINEENKDDRLKLIYANEIKEYQYRIDSNKATNEKRWDILNSSLNHIKALPFILAGTSIIAKLFTTYPWCH